MIKSLYVWEEYPERDAMLPIIKQYAPVLYNNKKRALVWDAFTADTFLTLLNGYTPIFLPLDNVRFTAARRGEDIKLRGSIVSPAFRDMVNKYDLSHNAMTYVIQTLYNLGCCEHEPFTTKTFHTIKLSPISKWVPELRIAIDSGAVSRGGNMLLAKEHGGLAKWVSRKGRKVRSYDDEELQSLLAYDHELLQQVPESWRGALYTFMIINCPETSARLTSSFCSYSKEFREALLQHIGLNDYVEVDYPAMIPSICALANGRKDVGFGGADLYTEILDTVRWNALTRSIIKDLILPAIGGSNEYKSQHGLAGKFFEHRLPSNYVKPFIAKLREVPFLNGMIGTNKLRPAFIIESRLQLRNIRDIHTLTGAVAFPVYDCLYVPRSIESKAKEIMQKNLLSMEVIL